MPIPLHKCDRWQWDTRFAWGLLLSQQLQEFAKSLSKSIFGYKRQELLWNDTIRVYLSTSPQLQSVYLNWSLNEVSCIAGRHGKKSKSNRKTWNRRVSIRYICTEHTALAFRKGQAMTSSKLTSSRLHRLCPYINCTYAKYCLSVVSMRCLLRFHRICLSSTVDTTWSILQGHEHAFRIVFFHFLDTELLIMSFCSKSARHVWQTWWTLAFQHLKELNLGRVGHLHSTLRPRPQLSPGSALLALLGPPETTNIIRV